MAHFFLEFNNSPLPDYTSLSTHVLKGTLLTSKFLLLFILNNLYIYSLIWVGANSSSGNVIRWWVVGCFSKYLSLPPSITQYKCIYLSSCKSVSFSPPKKWSLKIPQTLLFNNRLSFSQFLNYTLTLFSFLSPFFF